MKLNYSGDLEKAEACFKRGIETDPTCALSYSNLGALYGQMNRFADSDAAFSKAMELDSTCDSVYLKKGQYYVQVLSTGMPGLTPDQLLATAVRCEYANVFVQ